ncbi:toprim domain-containing protein [Methanolobus sp. ZRKC3]|uniref:toprim domain-containing protein n=1 Tax=Methanolobus sp. ZRKC3 TaxID=3125786 RepID=UPI00324DA847
MRRDSDKESVKGPVELYQRKLEAMDEIMDDLLQYAENDAVIIVEGIKDVRALNSLGIKGHFELATHHSLSNFCERIAREHNNVVILTDWDRRGNILKGKLVRNFHSLGVNPDVILRKRLFLLVQKEIKDVEGLPSYISKIKWMAKATEYPE